MHVEGRHELNLRLKIMDRHLCQKAMTVAADLLPDDTLQLLRTSDGTYKWTHVHQIHPRIRLFYKDVLGVSFDQFRLWNVSEPFGDFQPNACASARGCTSRSVVQYARQDDVPDGYHRSIVVCCHINVQ